MSPPAPRSIQGTTRCIPSASGAARFIFPRSLPGMPPPAAATASATRLPSTRVTSPGSRTAPRKRERSPWTAPRPWSGLPQETSEQPGGPGESIAAGARPRQSRCAGETAPPGTRSPASYTSRREGITGLSVGTPDLYQGSPLEGRGSRRRPPLVPRYQPTTCRIGSSRKADFLIACGQVADRRSGRLADRNPRTPSDDER